MSSGVVGTHSGAGPLSLMSCVRESSPPDLESDTEKNVSSKKRFWNPRKWFKRKNKVTEDVLAVEKNCDIGKEALRSRSTSELSIADEGRRRNSGSMHPGLSVSHDSVFHSPNSGSDMELDVAESSSSLSISQPFVDQRLQNELSERLKLRRGRGDTSEDDEGLPHSPCNSPTTSDGLFLDKTATKDFPTKSHSSYSDGSLLSMGSYELDEDNVRLSSKDPSKQTIQEKDDVPDLPFEFEPNSLTVPLNHSAAHHRVSVKPKRTHGVPRRKRGPLSTALPVTPEVNEDSSLRSVSPEINKKEAVHVLFSTQTTTNITNSQIKCSSLPPGLTPPGPESNKLNRSKSNAGSKSQDSFSVLHEDKEQKLSLLDRIFPRRSGRKKKYKEENTVKQETVTHEKISAESREEKKSYKSDIFISSYNTQTESFNSYNYISSKRECSNPIPAPRTGPASRQRIIPVDIAASPEEIRKEIPVTLKSSPDRSIEGTSPLQTELENRIKHKQIQPSSSPLSQSYLQTSPPQSPKFTVNNKTHQIHFTKSATTATNYAHIRFKGEDIRSKMKIPRLSSLQQKVLSLNDDEPDNEKSFKSLIEFPDDILKNSKSITKSHSFKTIKNPSIPETYDLKSATKCFIEAEKKEDNGKRIIKAASLDSIKNDERIHTSEVELKLKHLAPETTKDEDVIEMLETDTQIVNKNLSKPEIFSDSAITISGPSHTAIVNVTNNIDNFTTAKNNNQTYESTEKLTDKSHIVNIKEQQISVTKIQVKRESSHFTQSTVMIPNPTVPEFLNKHLNKVETKSGSNVILSIKSPKVVEDSSDQSESIFDFETSSEIVNKPPALRKFSKENLEIIEKNDKDESPSPTLVNLVNRYKKNEIKKTSLISQGSEPAGMNKPLFKTKSASLDSLKGDIHDADDKSSQDSLDKHSDSTKETSTTENSVVFRRKSLVNKKTEEEPELMKVFARRSLKLKDSEVDAIQDSLLENKARDSDKENQVDAPVDDRKKTFVKSQDCGNESISKKKPSLKDMKKDDSLDAKDSNREISVKNMTTEGSNNNDKETTPVSPPVLRRTFNNNIFLGQRTTSLQNRQLNTVSSEQVMKKQISVMERRKTDQWITKSADIQTKEKTIEDILPQTDFINESKNFSQRKAEWEKRAQQASLKKNIP